VASVLSGADRLDQPGALAVDLRWEGAPADTFAGGAIRVEGLDDHHVFVLHTDEEESVWELSADGVAGLRQALLASHRPSTVAEVLAAAEA
ncbi:MAG TPA: hypothetical protein VGE43_05955, partial [Acidimicrobiales bacterium]